MGVITTKVTYSVKITWKILGLVTGGDANASTLNLYTFEDSIEKTGQFKTFNYENICVYNYTSAPRRICL